MTSTKTITAAEAKGTIQAIVIMKDGSRIERTISYAAEARHGWQTAMRHAGAGLQAEQIESLITITGGRWGTEVSHYSGPTEAAEILGL